MIELILYRLEDIHGKFFESKVFENLNPEKVEEFDKQFPYMKKLKLLGQWE
ncbi:MULTISPECIES: hypothetical protein [Clostridium]|jgi:hypothetical protein|uniref:Uncharacterized protein n=1 Tax=Clostridium tertium TaxID=1559 RepID=A0A9X4AYI3_9CLOT|nr:MULTISPECIES: hypothetical protein [Clostridium]MBS5306666.1 hypothetical protein [Clostridium sp.]MDB1949254.1 hypothetical protein [Clostridium tertium]MDC4238779.1 hypothetical protein [Clostridium tertium]MDI9218478.1 hypothetical protein [Clostridium tertium]MDU3549461.1 hypothetical protein [Clostridium sp.]